jgi:prepilin-type N-terminal cleavage/methylation domain-containing protein/prepilin-type processing-associated H-X9-DG protein
LGASSTITAISNLEFAKGNMTKRRIILLGSSLLGGFTLVEVLVVVAIIAILAAILIPVGKSMMEKGNSAMCINNLRQIGGAIQQYSADNDGFFPYSAGPSYEGKSTSHPFSGWQAPLAYYLGTGQLSPFTIYKSQASYDNPTARHPFNCPSCKTAFRTYTANKYAMGFLPSGATSPYPRRKPTAFLRPSQLIVIADSATVDGQVTANSGAFDDTNYQTTIGTRHSGKANALFADFHIEAIDRATIDPAKNIKHN